MTILLNSIPFIPLFVTTIYLFFNIAIRGLNKLKTNVFSKRHLGWTPLLAVYCVHRVRFFFHVRPQHNGCHDAAACLRIIIIRACIYYLAVYYVRISAARGSDARTVGGGLGVWVVERERQNKRSNESLYYIHVYTIHLYI